MNGFERKVIEFNDEHKLIEKGDSVLVGVSGGADSMALLQFVLNQRDVLELKIHVAHFNHMFRGDESDADEKLVKEFCDKNSIAFVSKQKDIPKIVNETGENSQLTSRNHRYEFYQEVIEKEDIDKLLLAHHLDDLAENAIMNLVRGVDSVKQIGIPIKRELGRAEIARPFMCVSKEEIYCYLQDESVSFREDSSNKNLKYTRNRIRQNIIPLLKEENAQCLQHIAEFYEQIKADDEYIQSQVIAAFEKINIECDNGVYSVEIKELFGFAKTLQRRLYKLILEYVFSIEKSNFANKHIDVVINLAENAQSSSVFEIEQSHFVEKSFDKLLFYVGEKDSKYFEMEIEFQGVTLLPNGDRFTTELKTQKEELCEDEFVFSEELIVRSRVDGDRIEVPGLGRKKLKKMFSEKKIPIHKRDEWPILAKKSNTKEIVWVPHVFKKNLDVENEHLFKIKFIKNNGEV